VQTRLDQPSLSGGDIEHFSAGLRFFSFWAAALEKARAAFSMA
jgi:hypothetical protein